MPTKSLNILIVEDNPGDVRLISEMLGEDVGLRVTLTNAGRIRDALAILKSAKFDVILLDLNLPDSRGTEGLEKINAQNPETPVIVLTGLEDESTGIQAIQKHAQDYLVKGRIQTGLLVRSIRYAIERSRQEENLSRERNNLLMMFDAVNVGMLLVDKNGVVKRVNNAINRWVVNGPQAAKDPQPGDFLRCIHALNESVGCGRTVHCSACPIRKAFNAVVNSGEPSHGVEGEVTLSMKGLAVRLWLEVSADPLDIDGKFHVILALNNISDHKKAEDILRRDKEMLERLIEERSNKLVEAQMDLERARHLSDMGTLAATVAHELRNPLAAITMAASNIRRKTIGAPIERHLDNIEKKVAESDQIIDNLLSYSRLKAPQYQEIGIFEILDECAEVAQQRFVKKIALVKKFGSLRGLSLQADPLQIKEIFCNILVNAHDAIEDENGRIEFEGVKGRDVIRIEVKDNGSGMDKESLQRVFDPFFTTKASGTGLGLTICHRIIKMHGGAIDIKSKQGKGTRVIVTLPMKKKFLFP